MLWNETRHLACFSPLLNADDCALKSLFYVLGITIKNNLHKQIFHTNRFCSSLLKHPAIYFLFYCVRCTSVRYFDLSKINIFKQ